VTTETTDYGFTPRRFEVPDGRIHYVDEGMGPAVVLVHGTPTWSYLYRHLIRSLSDSYRVVVPDHLGFGRSDKPAEADYRPAAHAENLARLLDHLGLEGIVLGVHDFGGPIGLSYAVERPDNVRGLVLFNTWLWSLEGTAAERASRLLGGRLGRFLYTRLNLSPRVLLKAAFGNRRRLTRAVHAGYLEPFASTDEREAPWVLARELMGSTEWYQGLWEQRARIIHKPSLLLWGMKDPTFGPDHLAQWTGELTDARVVQVPEAGHFVPEEAPDLVAREVRAFLDGL
jgi:pimeloyl-ACP methyl ester carboxylesterase